MGSLRIKGFISRRTCPSDMDRNLEEQWGVDIVAALRSHSKWPATATATQIIRHFPTRLYTNCNENGRDFHLLHVRRYVHTYTHICTYIHTYTFLIILEQNLFLVYIYTFTYTHTSYSIVHTYIHTYKYYQHTYTHTYICTHSFY